MVLTLPQPLLGKRVLAFVGDIYEDLELWYPKLRLIEAGAEFITAGEEAGRVYEGKNGYPCKSDFAIDDMNSSDFDAVLLPGGFMPDRLRRLDRVKHLISEFSSQGKCVAAICHGGWLAISAGVYRGVRVTGSPGIKDDLIRDDLISDDQISDDQISDDWISNDRIIDDCVSDDCISDGCITMSVITSVLTTISGTAVSVA
jgi:protease I